MRKRARRSRSRSAEEAPALRLGDQLKTADSPSVAPPSPRALTVIFFLSGAAALVYQVVWSRLLSEVFGVTVYAVTTVLATFLGGLALGGWLLGRIADRRDDPLRLYGWLEIGIGFTGLLGTLVVRALDPVHIWAANRLAPDSAALIGVRALLACLVILPPTFFMGGTLPAMTRVFVGHIHLLGSRLSFLYAINTFGAVAGTLATGFLLIRWVGLHPTLWMAAATNLALGLASIRLADGLGRTGPGERRHDSEEEVTAQREADGRGLLMVVTLSGFASLGLEVLWTRALVLALGTTTYAFVTMLASFLLGLALGGALARLIVDRVGSLRRTFGWVELGVATATLATLPLLVRLASGGTEQWLDALGADWMTLFAARFGVSFLVMLVPATLIGMTFPMAARMWARDVRSLGGRVGELYAANTLGNIFGAAVTGFVLLSAVGLQRGIALMATLSLAAAAWGLLPTGRTRISSLLLAVPALVALGMGILLWKPRPFEVEERRQAQELLYYREDVVNVVSVYGDRSNPRSRSMLLDGVTIGASYRGVDEKQQALAHFPFLLLPDAPPRRVLSIGLGTGILIGEAALHPGVEAVDCVELSPAVIEAARLFAEFNQGALDNPAVRIINDDGVNFLRRSPARYDAIISDAKSRSGHSGNALFYSLDYYDACREHLTPGGLMIQWVPLDVPSEELPIIVRTFRDAFPHVYVWVAPPLSSFLIGSMQPLVLDVPFIERSLADAATASLRRYGWRDAYGFLSLLVADGESLEPWLAGDPMVSTIEHPVLEFHSPWAFSSPASERTASNLTTLAAARREPLRNVRLRGADPAAVEANDRAARRLLEASALLLTPGLAAKQRALGLLEEAVMAAPENGPIRYAAARAYHELGNAAQAQGAIDQAVAYYQQAVRLVPDFVEARGNLGSALLVRGATAEAASEFERALLDNPDDARAHYDLGVALALQQRFEEAAGHFRQALQTNPAHAEAQDGLRRVLAAQGERDGAPAR